jgi:hypothetical protein
MELNIVGDIAGRYQDLLELYEKMPRKATPVSVGDMIDRGPQSKEVLDFFMENGLAILGNHEHLLLETYDNTTYYDPLLWVMNGGMHTLISFEKDLEDDPKAKDIERIGMMAGLLPQELVEERHKEFVELVRKVIPVNYIDWLKKLPLYLEFEGIIISHAPIAPHKPFEKCLDLGKDAFSDQCEESVLWNRGKTRKRENQLQVFGHTSYRRAIWFFDHAVCVDTSKEEFLSGIHWPSKLTYTSKEHRP